MYSFINFRDKIYKNLEYLVYQKPLYVFNTPILFRTNCGKCKHCLDMPKFGG